MPTAEELEVAIDVWVKNFSLNDVEEINKYIAKKIKVCQQVYSDLKTQKKPERKL